MENHYQLTDNEFERQFSDLSLTPTLFSHEAHLRLAWIHIRKYGIKKAIDNISQQIKLFATHHGDEDKYNETVTVAAVRTVYHFILKSSSENFSEFIREYPRLKNEFKGLIDSHYSTNIFTSEKAKQEFMEPDLAPYDELRGNVNSVSHQ